MTAAVPAAAIAGAGVTYAIASWLARAASTRRRSLNRASLETVARSVLGSAARVLPAAVARAGRRDVRALIALAGLSGRVTSRDVAAARVVAGLGALALSPRVAAVGPPRLVPVLVVGWLAAAAELPVWWLRLHGRRRAEALRAALPDALELLRGCLVAGVPVRRALGLVGEHCAEPVSAELRGASAEMSLGVPLATALDGLAARNPVPEIRSLVAAVRQAQRHGSALAPVVEAQAEEVRRGRDRELVERAARAGPKIQLIVAATLVPAALLGFAAAVGAAIARGDLRLL